MSCKTMLRNNPLIESQDIEEIDLEKEEDNIIMLLQDVEKQDFLRVFNELYERGGSDKKLALVLKIAVEEEWFMLGIKNRRP